MNISYNKKFDLFQNGNYIGSFNFKEEIEKWLEKNAKDIGLFQMNTRRYSIIESSHLRFN